MSVQALERQQTATSVQKTPGLRQQLANRGIDGVTLMILPAFLFVLGVFVYPFLYGLVLSFNPLDGGGALANYQKFFSDPYLYKTIGATLWLAVPVTIISGLLAVPVAMRVRLMVSAAMLIAEMPELGKMTSGEAAAMTGLAPVPYDSGTMRGKRMIAGGRRALSGCTRRCLSQPCSQISRTTTERAWQTPQARYRRCRKKARNNRKRDPQKRRLMEPSKSNLDTAASSFFFDGSV